MTNADRLVLGLLDFCCLPPWPLVLGCFPTVRRRLWLQGRAAKKGEERGSNRWNGIDNSVWFREEGWSAMKIEIEPCVLHASYCCRTGAVERVETRSTGCQQPVRRSTLPLKVTYVVDVLPGLRNLRMECLESK